MNIVPTLDPLEPGDLPSSYGANRLVLLPVDPYLIHVYWELSSTVPPAAGSRPILRFYESPASTTLDVSRPFDVDIDFSTSSWYVNLWSPDKIYYADLGWRREDGSFQSLARSNTVLTPPASPRPAEPVEETALQPAPSEVEEAPVEEAPVEVEPVVTAIAPDPVPAPAPLPVEPPLADANEFLDRRLAEMYAIRGELPPLREPDEFPFAPADEIPGEPSQLDAPTPAAWSGSEEQDLTQLSEEHFTPGISSEWNSLGE